MRNVAVVLLLSCLFAGTFARSACAATPVSVAGKWNVTVRMPGGPVMEQWTIEQKGTTVTGTAKGQHGELPVSGTVEGAFFRVTIKDGDKQIKVRATVDGNDMDGSVTFGVGDARLWFAKRAAGGK